MATEPPGVTEFVPYYASYNWTGGPADFSQSTNRIGGDSSMASMDVHSGALLTISVGHENLNKWFQSGDTAFIIVASAMVSSPYLSIRAREAL